MKLHQLEKEFKELISLTSAEFGIADVLIEKDYWVTLALKNLSESNLLERWFLRAGRPCLRHIKLFIVFQKTLIWRSLLMKE